jgi:hypothetical protein
MLRSDRLAPTELADEVLASVERIRQLSLLFNLRLRGWRGLPVLSGVSP